jgi:hypothetical protein
MMTFENGMGFAPWFGDRKTNATHEEFQQIYREAACHLVSGYRSNIVTVASVRSAS